MLQLFGRSMQTRHSQHESTGKSVPLSMVHGASSDRQTSEQLCMCICNMLLLTSIKEDSGKDMIQRTVMHVAM